MARTPTDYRPDIDGLRAIAVLAVIGFHAFPGWVKGGLFGVDVFFVISGFLISSIIFKGLRDGSFSYADFYARRIKRIFPALIVVLAACLAGGWFVLYPDEYRALGRHAAAGAGFVYNFLAWLEVGYFDREAVAKPLLHLWSLGVEEQFYFVWPLLLALLYRRTQMLALGLGSLLLASFALHMVLLQTHPSAAFYFPVTRLWELGAGSLLAYTSGFARGREPGLIEAAIAAVHRWGARHRLGLAWLGLALLLAGILPRQRPIPDWWVLLPTSGTVLLIATGPGTWLHQKLLVQRPLVVTGLISYPLYLWHWPLLSFAHIAEQGLPSRGMRIALVAAAFILAWLTYVLVEKPVRFRGRT
ncbi:MAG: acyltransferase, partial [Acidobacteria bacterium]|nr:acyltransferase [Acidobacteriota bacterium]